MRKDGKQLNDSRQKPALKALEKTLIFIKNKLEYSYCANFVAPLFMVN